MGCDWIKIKRRIKMKLFGAFHPSRGINDKFCHGKSINKFILTVRIKSSNKI